MTDKSKSQPGDWGGNLADEVSGELAALIDTANAAIQPILGDKAIWAQEAAAGATTVLPWPLASVENGGYPELLRWFAIEAVQNVLDAMARQQGLPDGSIRAPADTSEPGFQVVLRVCKRAVDAADAAVLKEFAGAGRVDGMRALKGWLIRKNIEHLQRTEPGISVADAAARVGVSTAAAYRWIGKKR